MAYQCPLGYMHVMNMVPWDILSLVLNLMLQQLGCDDHRSDEITPSNMVISIQLKINTTQ